MRFGGFGLPGWDLCGGVSGSVERDEGKRTVLVFKPLPKPAMKRPTRSCAQEKELAWRIAPTIMMLVPVRMVLRRPRTSPIQMVRMAPKMQPSWKMPAVRPGCRVLGQIQACEMDSLTLIYSVHCPRVASQVVPNELWKLTLKRLKRQHSPHYTLIVAKQPCTRIRKALKSRSPKSLQEVHPSHQTDSPAKSLSRHAMVFPHRLSIIRRLRNMRLGVLWSSRRRQKRVV